MILLVLAYSISIWNSGSIETEDYVLLIILSFGLIQVAYFTSKMATVSLENNKIVLGNYFKNTTIMIDEISGISPFVGDKSSLICRLEFTHNGQHHEVLIIGDNG
jgi:hypothetical protein